MTSNDPRHGVAEGPLVSSDDHILWHHSAFCQLGLPLRASNAPWGRSLASAGVTIEPGAAADLPLPSGRLLRLLLLHVCDAAVRAEGPIVDMESSAAGFATRIGLEAKTAKLRELCEQMDRVLAAKIMVALDGGPAMSVFDARCRARADAEWRTTLRLNARFRASLLANKVALDRRLVAILMDSSAALDAYLWTRQALQHAVGDETVTTAWPDLARRFGTASQDAAQFRAGFEEALRRVFEADHSIAVAADEEGVTLRGVLPEVTAPPPDRSAPPPAEPALAVPPAKAVSPAPAPAPIPEPLPAPAPPAPVPAPAAVEPPPLPAAPFESVSLRSELTGLPQVVWLRRGHGQPIVLIGVTPNARFDPDRLTLLALEPIVMQVSGGLFQADFDRVAAWAMVNRDLIDDVWDGQIDSAEAVLARVRKTPAPGWR